MNITNSKKNVNHLLHLNTFLLLVFHQILSFSQKDTLLICIAYTLLLSTIFLYFIMLQQYVVLREAILGKNRCTRNVSWMLYHYLQKEEEKRWYYSFLLKIKYLITKLMMLVIKRFFLTQKLQRFSKYILHFCPGL